MMRDVSRNIQWKIFAAVLLIFCCATVVASQNVELGGYVKNYFAVNDYPSIVSSFGDPYTFPPTTSVTNRLRLHLQLTPSERIAMHIAYDLVPRVDDRSAALFSLSELWKFDATGGYRVADFKRQIYPSLNEPVDNFWIDQSLDRAFVSVKTEKADIVVGRQAIAFGSARVINPTDVIAPFAYQTLDTEDRVGVDAIRVRQAIGSMGEFDFGYLPGYDWEFKNGAVFSRVKIYAARTDITSIAAIFRDNLMLGLDIARAVGGAGTWVEAAHVWTDEFAKPKPEERQKYFRLSAGADYFFTSKLYGFFEYHYNGAGENDAGRYWSVAQSTAIREGNVYYFGKHYVIPGTTYQITPLIIGSAQVLTNLSDLSFFFSPSIEYNIAENVYLSGGAFIGVGESAGSLEETGQPSPPGSEFGRYPDIYYTSFRVYF